MKRMLLEGFAACCLILAVGTAGAQERNMARLTLDDTTYVNILLGLHGEDGDFQEKDILMPESMARGSLDATSRRKLGRVSKRVFA